MWVLSGGFHCRIALYMALASKQDPNSQLSQLSGPTPYSQGRGFQLMDVSVPDIALDLP